MSMGLCPTRASRAGEPPLKIRWKWPIIPFWGGSKILGLRQATKKFYNKCSENSRSQIVFRTDIFQKLSLGAPDSRLCLLFRIDEAKEERYRGLMCQLIKVTWFIWSCPLTSCFTSSQSMSEPTESYVKRTCMFVLSIATFIFIF